MFEKKSNFQKFMSDDTDNTNTMIVKLRNETLHQ